MSLRVRRPAPPGVAGQATSEYLVVVAAVALALFGRWFDERSVAALLAEALGRWHEHVLFLVAHS